tara:strand:+ start:380 stop:580 length:201 start_codon:yes stop_codon:yes gene_type:complete
MASKKTQLEMILQQLKDKPKMTAIQLSGLTEILGQIAGIPGLKRGGAVKKRQPVKKTTTKKKTKRR